MTQETVTYLAHSVIGAIVASLMTRKWQAHGKTESECHWMIAAWVMTAADLLFAIRPVLPYWIGRSVPPILVTIGSAMLLLGARRTVKLLGWTRRTWSLVFLYALGLSAGLLVPVLGNWRMVWNGAFWGMLSLISYRVLRKGNPVFWRGALSPAVVFLTHGCFQFLRSGVAVVRSLGDVGAMTTWLQLAGDLEVSFFMVALFVSLLLAHLELRNEELSQALVEVQTLSGLLPICAWCHKVRNDSGYWQRLEDYFSSRSGLKFTHGICVDCSTEQHEEIARISKE